MSTSGPDFGRFRRAFGGGFPKRPRKPALLQMEVCERTTHGRRIAGVRPPQSPVQRSGTRTVPATPTRLWMRRRRASLRPTLLILRYSTLRFRERPMERTTHEFSGVLSGLGRSYRDGLLFLLVLSFFAPFPSTPPLLSPKSKPPDFSDRSPNETAAYSNPSTTTATSPRSRSNSSSFPALDPLNSGSSSSKTMGWSTAGR